MKCSLCGKELEYSDTLLIMFKGGPDGNSDERKIMHLTHPFDKRFENNRAERVIRIDGITYGILCSTPVNSLTTIRFILNDYHL